MNKIIDVVTSEWFILAAWIAASLIGYGFAHDSDGVPILAFIVITGAIAFFLTYRAGQRSRNAAIRFWISRALIYNADANREFYAFVCGEEKATERTNIAWNNLQRPVDSEWNQL